MEEDNLVDLVIEDKYKLDRKIGEGGMGAVYLGTQLMVDRNVAIKLLHTGLSGHERIKQRFEVEAKAIGRMNHPNCITLFDFGFSSELDAFYMVMEYLDGTPMHRRVVEGVGAQEAVDITRQIAMALDHAHHQGILHRDLKPENVMLTQMTDGSQLVKVLDFGIARIFQDGDEEQKTTQEQNRLTRAGEVFGTPAYISPEQARGDRDLTPSSDLYSLGVMLYEMLQGELPFWGETAIDTIMKHITSPVPRLTRIDIPNDLKELTYTLLDKDPTNRPQSGRELAERLGAISFAPRRQVPVGAMAGGMGAGSIGASLGSNLSQEFPFVPDNGSTIPEMGMSGPELNEWAEAGQTVVQKPGRAGHMTMPPNQPLRPPAVADGSSSDLFIHPGPHTTGEFYTDSFETQSRPAWLVPVILLLALAMAAGVGFFAFGPTETQANQTGPDSKQSVADKSDPGDKVEAPPEVKDKNDVADKKPAATSAKKSKVNKTTPPSKDDKAGIELFEEKKDPTPKDTKRTATKKKTTTKKKRDDSRKKVERKTEKKPDKKEDKTSIPSLSLDRDKDDKKEPKSDKPRSIEL